MIPIIKKLDGKENVLYCDIQSQEQKENKIEKILRSIGDMLPYDIWYADKEGYMQYFSPSFLNQLCMTMQEACDYGWTSRILEEDVAPVLNRWFYCLKTGEEWEYEYRIRDGFGLVKTVCSRGKPVRDKKGVLSGWVGINLDVTDSKEDQKHLKEIEWMVNKEYLPVYANEVLDKSNSDKFEYDESGYIVNSVSAELLAEITSGVLNLLDTSVCIFESDGKCSFRMIRSRWCHCLSDLAKKNVMYHGSYMRKLNEKVISSNKSFDSECTGGINVFSVPVRMAGKAIGSICIGYGNPPQDSKILNQIALHYNGDYRLIMDAGKNYNCRPAFIINLARKNLVSSARIIETVLDRKRAEIALQEAYSEIEKRIEIRAKALNRSYSSLKKETKKRMTVERQMALINKAIEAIYTIVSDLSVSHETVINKVVFSISSIFSFPFVAIGMVEKNVFIRISQKCKDKCDILNNVKIENHPCGIALRDEKFKQLYGDLKQFYPLFEEYSIHPRVYFGLPVLSSKGVVLGTVCLCDEGNRILEEYEINWIQIFTRCIGYVIEKRGIEHQLSQSQEMKILGQLTSGVAHEVRNPLNGILAITDALSKDLKENPEYNVYIEHIRRQVIRLTDLMRDLLDLGRPIEKGNLLPTSVIWLVSNAINYWKQSSDYRNRVIKVICSRESENITIYADRPKIEQVIINLLENGCAHSRIDQEILIDIKCAGKFISIQITDRGTGIKPEHIDHLFEPFFTTRKNGTGLGLGIVKRIVESHGGSICIRNNIPTPGVTAEIKIPVLKNKEEKE